MNLNFAKYFVKRNILQSVNLNSCILSLDNNVFQTIQKLIDFHGTICIKNQNLNQYQLKELINKFGAVVKLPKEMLFMNEFEDCPEICRVGNVKKDGSHDEKMAYAETWRHDGDFNKNNDKYILNFLHAKEVPNEGGKTGFLDTKLGFELFPVDLKVELEGSVITVDPSLIPDFKSALKSIIPPPQNHDIFYKHPKLGFKSVYVGGGPHTKVINKSGIETKYTGDYLFTKMEELGVRKDHSWEVGDLLIWDNLQVAHRSLGGYYKHRRLLFRGQAKL